MNKSSFVFNNLYASTKLLLINMNLFKEIRDDREVLLIIHVQFQLENTMNSLLHSGLLRLYLHNDFKY